MIVFLADVGGWIGVFCLLLAYGLISKGLVSGKSVSYQGLNISGSLLMIFNSAYYGAMPSVAVNIIWVMIGGFSLWMIRGKIKNEQK